MTQQAVPTLLHVYSTFKVGGPQMRFARLVNHFGGEFRHLIVSMDGATEAFDLLQKNVDARMVDVPRRSRNTWDSMTAFRSALKQIQPDLLVTSNWGAIEWAMANLDGMVPHLHMEDGFGPEEANCQLPRRVWTRRLVLRRSTVLLPSMTLFRLASDVWCLPRKRLVLVANGIDCEKFCDRQDSSFASSLGIAGDRPVIGTVAALRAEKNLLRLVDAFALVCRQRAAQLVIVGSGPQKSLLESRAAELGVAEHVLFTGACATPERILPSFTVFAMSSDTEQMPISLLEAMAAGRPVAATDVGDVAIMVAEQNRPFVVPADAGRLAEAMAQLLDTPAVAQGIGVANARRAREVYDQEAMFAAYRHLYRGVDLSASNVAR